MSKQSEAKAAQNYVEKAPCCGDCRNLKSELVLPAWMARHNASIQELGQSPTYTTDRHGVEKNLRCGIGGFKVKKMGACCQHQPAQ